MALPGLLDEPARRARMDELGRNRVVNELAWQYAAPKLLAAYAVVAVRSALVREGRWQAGYRRQGIADIRQAV